MSKEAIVMSSTREAVQRFDSLDGLRGIAALIVVIGHFWPYESFKSLPIINLFMDTKLPVAVFFVLSGVVLTHASRNFEKNVRWLAFTLISRYLRLMVPILAISLIVTLLSALGMIYVDHLPDRYHLWAGYQIFYQFDVSWLGALNFSFYEVFFNYDPSKTYIPPAWTMRPELFASTILYVFLFGYYLLRLDRLPVLIWIPFAVAVFMTKAKIPGLYYFGYFMVGYVIYSCYVGAARQNLFSPWFFVLVVSAKSILFFFAVKGLLVDFLFASLLVFSILFSSTLQSLFANQLFGWLGKISFPLYLIHVPIITTMGMYNFVLLDALGLPPLMGGMINFTAVMAVCLGAAHLLTFVDIETLRLLRVMKSRAGLTIKARAEGSGARL